MSEAKSGGDDKAIWRVGPEAVKRGGEVGGAYLDSIGITDMALMNEAQWTLFLTKVVGGALLAAIGDVYGDEVPF